MTYSTVNERLFFELIDGVENGSVQRVRDALDAGADITMRLSTGNTALGKAAGRDSLEIVQILLAEAALKVHDKTWFDTGLVAASSQSATPIGPQFVRLILEAGANPNAATSNCTALQSAVFAHNVESTRLLIEAGADVDGIAEGFNLVPLVIAMGMVGSLHREAGFKCALELTEMLARAGANAGYEPTKGGWASPEQGMLTPYQYAMSIERFDIVTSLTHLAGQDPRQVTADGRSMLDLLPPKGLKKKEAARLFLLSLATEVDIRRSVCGVGDPERQPRPKMPSL